MRWSLGRACRVELLAQLCRRRSGASFARQGTGGQRAARAERTVSVDIPRQDQPGHPGLHSGLGTEGRRRGAERAVHRLGRRGLRHDGCVRRPGPDPEYAPDRRSRCPVLEFPYHGAVFADPCVVVDGPECDLERPFYGYLGGESSSWYPDLIHDNHSVDPPGTPEDGYHLSKDLSDHAIRFIRDAKVVDPDKPFFLYLAPQAGHAPHHVFPEWADRYKGQFDQGYEAIRTEILQRQKDLGLLPADTQLSRSTRTVSPRRPDRTGNPGRRWTPSGRGTPSPPTSNGCSPGWPRCTPATSPTPTSNSVE